MKSIGKKQWYGIAVAMVLILAFLFYFFRVPFTDIDPLEAIPSDALLVVEYPIHPSKTINTQNKNPYTQQCIAEINAFTKALFPSSKTPLAYFKEKNKQLSIGCFLNANKELENLYVLDFSFFDLNLIEKKISSEYKIKASEFKATKLYHLESEGHKFSISTYKNLLLFAQNAYLVEDAIRQLEDFHSNLLSQNTFNALKSNAKKGKAQYYINTSKAIEGLKDPAAFAKILGIQNISEQIQWINFNGKHLDKGAISLVRPPIKEAQNLDHILPNNVILHFDLDPKLEEQEGFATWHGTPAKLVITATSNRQWQNNSALLIPVKDSLKAIQALRQLAEKEGMPKPSNYLSYDVYQLPQTSPFPTIFGENHQGLNRPYFSIIEQHMLFSSNLAQHQLWIDKYVSSQTLANNIEYLQFKESKSNLTSPQLFYASQGILDLLRNLLKKELYTVFFANKQGNRFVSIYTKPKAGIHQFEREKSIALQQKRVSNITWKSRLQSPVQVAPKFVLDPRTNKKYILVQDRNKLLYAFDNQGNLLWTKDIKSPILSDYHLVDYDKNKNSQILFNTREQIHLLDFEGKDIGRYPVDFRSKASNGLIAFDIDKHQNFAFFIASENRKIYGYDLRGQPINGWNPKKDVGLIKKKGKYFFDEKEDYITFINTKGKFMAFDLRGAAHFDPIKIPNASGEIQFDIASSSKRFVLAQSNSKIKVSNMLGKSFKLSTFPNSKLTDFAFADVFGDKRKDYIVLSGKKLAVYGYNDKDKFVNHFKYEFDESQDKITPFKLVGQSKYSISTLDKTRAQIHLISSKGKPSPSFPISGQTTYDILRTKGKNQHLIVAKDRELICYQL